MTIFVANWHTWILLGGVAVFIWIFFMAGHAVLFRLSKRMTDSVRQSVFINALWRPAQAALTCIVLLILLPSTPLQANIQESIERGLDLLLIGCVAWMLMALIRAFDQSLVLKYRIDLSDNLAARQMRTRMQVLRHVANVTVILLTLAVALMTFPRVRSLGASLLASAGLAGIVVGMAARPTISNLLAGLQIALTEPIRLEDVVIVEGEWGWIEEIYATYVVVRIWDLRRMILPLSYFIEHPFQNWTRHSADIIGSVFLSVDYRTPIDPLRQELTRVLKSTPLWKGGVNVLQVTDATEHTIQLRAIMDSPSSGNSWDLRCLVREKLIEFLQKNYADSLPRVRAEMITPKAELKV